MGVAMLVSVVLLVCVAALAVLAGRQRRTIREQIDLTGRLRQGEQRLRHLTDAVPIGIFDVDHVSGETFVNRAFRDLTGGDWTALDGQLQLEMSNRVGAGGSFSTRIDVRRGGGSAEWLAIRATGTRDDDGTVTRLHGVVDDVTTDVDREARLLGERDAALAAARARTERVADTADPPDRPPSGATVLVVEDNEANRQVALGMLAKLGYSADIAEDGVEALEALHRARYDLVLMDCQMPRLDGYETTARIRALEGDGRHTPIIAMTASAMIGDRERCIAAGMDGYLAKPVDVDELADAIRRALGPDQATGQRSGLSDPAGETAPANPDLDRATALLDPEAVARLQQLPSEGGDTFDNVSMIFLRTSAREMDDARAAADAEDWDRLAYLIHQLGGSASIIGATSLTDRCRDLRACITDQPGPQRIRSALVDVEAELRRVRDVLVRTVGTTATGDERHPTGPRG